MTAPTTRFGSLLDDGNGAVSTHASSIDWSQVVADEPDNVVPWLLYLHRRQHLAIKDLFPALREQLKQCDSHTPQWNSFLHTGLPSALIDMASESDMFSLEVGAFKVSRSCTSELLPHFYSFL